RRTDSGEITGRIFDRRGAHYGKDAVFRDIDNIPPGIDFRKQVASALETTDILLAVLGPKWHGPTADGKSRISETGELLGVEIESALRKDIPVIPILVGNAT